MKMSNLQFNEAVAALRRGKRNDLSERECRLALAAAIVIKSRRGHPEDEEFTLEQEDLAEFLDSLGPVQRRRLRQMAEELTGVTRERIH